METIKIKAKVKLGKKLEDLRIGKRGLTFGVIENIAKQHGVSYEEIPNEPKYLIFTAPLKRMQMFVEKLHFSGISFEEL